MKTDNPITVKEVRALALSFPEVREEPHFDRASFRVRGRIDAHEALLAADPGTFFRRRRRSVAAPGRVPHGAPRGKDHEDRLSACLST